jgi:hypothetical protein
MFFAIIERLFLVALVCSAAEFVLSDQDECIDWPGEPAISMQANDFDARDGTFVRPVYISDEHGERIVYRDGDPWVSASVSSLVHYDRVLTDEEIRADLEAMERAYRERDEGE